MQPRLDEEPEKRRGAGDEAEQEGEAVALDFGMKLHGGVGAQSVLVNSLATTSAKMHELTVSEKLLQGEEVRVWGDGGYGGSGKGEAHWEG